MVEPVMTVTEAVEAMVAVVMMPEADERQICPVASMAPMMTVTVTVAVSGENDEGVSLGLMDQGAVRSSTGL